MFTLVKSFYRRLRAKSQYVHAEHPTEPSTFALNDLDLQLIRELDVSPNQPGFFVELGANDGLNQSNSFLLQRDYGWDGILIEPSPSKYLECVQNRSFSPSVKFTCAACVPFDYQEEFVPFEDSNLMSVCRGLTLSTADTTSHADLGAQFLKDPRFRIRYGALARTLTSILDENGAPANPDLLSLDVEGNELAVLHGLDFKRYKFRWMLFEVRNGEIYNQITSLLSTNGFMIHSVLHANDRYQDILFKKCA